jgi:hypothetical protein
MNGEARAEQQALHRFLLFLLPVLIVVLLSVDVPAGSVLPVLKPGSFLRRDSAIGLRPPLHTPGPRLLSFHSRGFAPGERAALHAVTNAPLLSTLAPINAWRFLRRYTDPERKQKHRR